MAVTPPLRWKKLECIVCNGTGLRGRLRRELEDKPCLACDGGLIFYVNENGEVAAHPDKPVAGTWGGKFQLLDESGVPDWSPGS